MQSFFYAFSFSHEHDRLSLTLGKKKKLLIIRYGMRHYTVIIINDYSMTDLKCIANILFRKLNRLLEIEVLFFLLALQFYF